MKHYYFIFPSIFLFTNLAFGANFDIPKLPLPEATNLQIEPNIQEPFSVVKKVLKPEKATSDLDSLDITPLQKKEDFAAPRKTPPQKTKNITLSEIKKPLHRFTRNNHPPKPPLAQEFSHRPRTSSRSTTKKITNTEPLYVTSSKQTHNLMGSGLYQNIIVMNENIKQIFSSKKISVEIRGPVAMLRLTSISGSEIDVQILTESFHVETFVFHINNKLPAQKFIVKGEKEEQEKEQNKKKTNGGQAIDTLITISNGKKPRGYKWIASDADRREYMGLGIREIGSYKKRHNEFIVFAITNETTAMASIKEWDLHNSIVLGSVKRARNVKLMSLDDYQISPGKTVIMYVGVHLVRKDGR